MTNIPVKHTNWYVWLQLHSIHFQSWGWRQRHHKLFSLFL